MVGHEPFAILLPDMLMAEGGLKQMMDAYQRVGGNLISVEEVPRADVSKYGIIDPGHQDGDLFEMKGMVEKPAVEEAPSNLMISGRYILQPEIFELLATQDKGAGGEIQLTDSMAKLMTLQDFHAVRYQGESYDIGSKIGLLEATVAYALASEEGDEARAVVRALL